MVDVHPPVNRQLPGYMQHASRAGCKILFNNCFSSTYRNPPLGDGRYHNEYVQTLSLIPRTQTWSLMGLGFLGALED